MDIIKRLCGLMAPYRKKIFLCALLQTCVILTRLVAPFLTRTIINDVIPNTDLNLLFYVSAGLLGLVLVRGLSRSCPRYR